MTIVFRASIAALLMTLAPASVAQQTPAAAQAPEAAPPHQSLTIASTVMGEDRVINIYTPPGYAEAAELTPREQEICAALGPQLKERGLIFVGIDVIGGEWLTEINVTSPTGIVAIDRFNNSDTAGMIWDAIERRIA